jgi:segregation and condensation protein A
MYEFTVADFKGPLEALLHVVRGGQMDAENLPVSELTAQFAAMMPDAEEDLARSFGYLLMLATLIELKSRALVPAREAAEPTPDAEAEEAEGPAAPAHPTVSLADVVAEFRKRFEETSRFIGGASLAAPSVEFEAENLSVFDLVATFESVMAAFEKRPVLVTREKKTVEEAVLEVTMEIRRAGGSMDLATLLTRAVDKIDVIVRFLAVLELIAKESLTFVSEGGRVVLYI